MPPSVGRSDSVDDFAIVPSFQHNNKKSNLGVSSDVDYSDLDSTINSDSAKGTVTSHYDTRAKRKATAPVRPVAAEMTITCL